MAQEPRLQLGGLGERSAIDQLAYVELKVRSCRKLPLAANIGNGREEVPTSGTWVYTILNRRQLLGTPSKARSPFGRGESSQGP